jgi:Ser/Thr protein kinase RdoA (MazF antagonist)
MSKLVPAALQPDILDRERTPAAAAALWGGEPGSLEHVSTGASFVFRFVAHGRRLYLRLTPPGWQDSAGLRAEYAYIEALHAAGIAVARAVLSRRGKPIEPVYERGRKFLAMVFEEAPGKHVAAEEWDATRALRFGRLLARVHEAAATVPPGQARRHFHHEVALTRAWLPASETALQARLDEAEAWAAGLPRTPDVYGLVHYDLAEDNILWSGGEPILIDFDDCMHTWFAADIARTLGMLHDSASGRYRAVAALCLEGYREVRAPDAVVEHWLPEFVRFNAISSLAWCLHARAGGLDIPDAGVESEQHLRDVIERPEAWCW